MTPLKIPSDSRVMDCSSPLYSEGDPEKAGVLLVHGFSGSPHDMVYLYERLVNQGHTVSVPRLPGHGTNAEDFKNSGWKDWYRGAADAFLELRSRCSRVYIAGLSMGGAITAMLAAQFGVEKIALAAPAFTFTPGSGASYLWITPVFSWAIGSSRTGSVDVKEYTGDRLLLEKEYKGWNWYRQGSELIRLRRRAIAALKRIQSDSLIIVSKSDKTVSYRCADYLRKRLVSAGSVEIMMLEKSGHVVVDDVDRQDVADRIINWFS